MNYDLNFIGNSFLAYIPNILRALVLLLVAWGVAVLAKKLIEKILVKTNMDRHLSKGTTPPDPENGKRRVSSISKIVYFLVFILFLPSILDALDMDSVSGPISNLFQI